MSETTTMRRSWLVQRLEKPLASGFLSGKDNPFSFGGGLKNGGLSGEAMSLLRPIFRFDYMGAAEFEFGAVPKALDLLAKAAHKKRLRTFSVEVPLSEVPQGWRAPKNAPTPDGVGVVYALVQRDHESEVRTRIEQWARDARPEMKESLNLSRSLRPVEEYDSRTQGWLELDNGFMFFTDRDMFAQTAAVFGVEVSA